MFGMVTIMGLYYINVECSDRFPVISSLRLVGSILCLKQFSIKLNGNENGKNQSFILFSYMRCCIVYLSVTVTSIRIRKTCIPLKGS